jgi:hypothetical protein
LLGHHDKISIQLIKAGPGCAGERFFTGNKIYNRQFLRIQILPGEYITIKDNKVNYQKEKPCSPA